MRFIIGLVLLAHGLAHLVGFMIPWRLLNDERTPSKTTVLDGKVEVGETGARTVGVLWLIGALAFVLAAVTCVAQWNWWKTATAAAAGYSLVLSALSWPESRVGAAINTGIIVALVVSRLFS